MPPCAVTAHGRKAAAGRAGFTCSVEQANNRILDVVMELSRARSVPADRALLEGDRGFDRVRGAPCWEPVQAGWR